MRFFRTSFIATLIIAAPLLTPAASAAPPATIGHMEAAVNFCSRTDPESADKYRALGKKVVEGMTEKELTDARNTNEYKDRYEAITTKLEKLPADKSAKVCRSMLNGDSK